MTYICKIMGEKVEEVNAETELKALNLAITIFGMDVDVCKK